MAPLARLQAVQAPRTHSITNQAQGRESRGGGHAPYLTVAALGDGQGQPAGGDAGPVAYRWLPGPEVGLGHLAGLGRGGQAVLELQALPEPLEGHLADFPFHLHPVGLGHFLLRVGDAVLDFTVIGEQQQALTVLVEPTGRVETGHIQVIREGPVTLPNRRELTQDIKRFIKNNKLRHIGKGYTFQQGDYFKGRQPCDAILMDNASNQNKKRICRLAMASLSLKQRFLLIALPVLFLSVGVVIYSAYLVQETTRQSIRDIDKSRQIDWQIRRIKETLQDLEVYIHQYTLISYSFDPETRNKIERGNSRLSSLVGILKDQISQENGDNLQYTQLIEQLDLQVQKLSQHVKQYQSMILEPNIRFPGMWLMEQKLLPANTRFIQVLEPAITELENEKINENSYKVINLLKDLRYVWVQQISWFRLFIANRSGIFGLPENSMKQNLENRQLYVDQVDAYLAELQKLDSENKLGLEVSSSLPVLTESFNDYKKHYQQIRDIYTSDAWRIDIAYLTSTIRPDFSKARMIVDKINRLQQADTDNNIQNSYAVARKISMMNWLSVAGIFLFMLVGYVIFEYLIRRPVLNIASALNAEAAGAPYTPLHDFRLA